MPFERHRRCRPDLRSWAALLSPAPRAGSSASRAWRIWRRGAKLAAVTSYVLVHGGNMSTETWNRATVGPPVVTPDGRMGGRIWAPVMGLLGTDPAIAPTLGDEHTSDLTEHIDQVVSLVLQRDLRDVVLAGHSYGGMVITGVADRLASRIQAVVYVDAALPDPGQSLFDIIRSGGVDPLSFEGLEAAPPYVEALHFDPGRLVAARRTYVLCTQSEFTIVTHVAKAKIDRQPEAWSYIELPTWHVPMADMPDRVAEILRTA